MKEDKLLLHLPLWTSGCTSSHLSCLTLAPSGGYRAIRFSFYSPFDIGDRCSLVVTRLSHSDNFVMTLYKCPLDLPSTHKHFNSLIPLLLIQMPIRASASVASYQWVLDCILCVTTHLNKRTIQSANTNMILLPQLSNPTCCRQKTD